MSITLLRPPQELLLAPKDSCLLSVSIVCNVLLSAGVAIVITRSIILTAPT